MTTESKKKTPPTWSTPPDARKKKGAGKYPNCWVRQTRSGHVMIFDDSKGAEHITLQHRKGTMFQMDSDGTLQIRASSSRVDVTYGAHRSVVTGAKDESVMGDKSTKVDGSYNSTIIGDSTQSIGGKSVLTATSKSEVVTEGVDTVSGWETKKVNNSSTTQVLGAATMLSKYGMTIGSTSSSMAIGAKKQVGIKSGQEMALEAGGKFSLKSGGAEIALVDGKIYMNSSRADTASDVVVMDEVPEPEKEEAIVA